MPRKLMAARADLAERAAATAKRKGMTLYAYLNEVLESALMLDEQQPSTSAKERGTIQAATHLARTLGMVLAPSDLWKRSSVTPAEEEDWAQLGLSAGTYLSSIDHGAELLGELLKLLSWNATMYTFAIDANGVRLETMGKDISDNQAKFIATLADHAMRALGYRLLQRSHSRGIVTMRFERQGSP